AFLRNALRIRAPPFLSGGGNLEPGRYPVNGVRADDLAVKIVRIRVCDFGKYQNAGSGIAAQVHDAIDLGRLIAAATEKRPQLATFALDHPLDRASHLRARAACRHARLRLHDAFPAPALDGLGQVSAQLRGVRALLARVAEHADPIELGLLEKVAQLVDVRLGLSGESDDECSPQRDAGHEWADAAT